MLGEAVEIYRARFRPGVTAASRFMLAVNLFAAETDEAAHLLRSSMVQGFINLRRGKAGPLPPPCADLSTVASPAEIAMAERALRVVAVGSPSSVEVRLRGYIETFQPDEIILTGHIFDHAARLNSFRIGAEAMARINAGR